MPGNKEIAVVSFNGEEVPFGTNILLEAEGMEGLMVGCEICEDIWVPQEPAVSHALAGATVLVNLSASDETIGKGAYREMLVKSSSARLIAGYIYCSCGDGESTQDLVYGGHDMIAENGIIIAQSKRFTNQIVYGDLDIGRLRMERRRMNTFPCGDGSRYLVLPLDWKRWRQSWKGHFPVCLSCLLTKVSGRGVARRFYPYRPQALRSGLPIQDAVKRLSVCPGAGFYSGTAGYGKNF